MSTTNLEENEEEVLNDPAWKPLNLKREIFESGQNLPGSIPNSEGNKNRVSAFSVKSITNNFDIESGIVEQRKNAVIESTDSNVDLSKKTEPNIEAYSASNEAKQLKQLLEHNSSASSPLMKRNVKKDISHSNKKSLPPPPKQLSKYSDDQISSLNSLCQEIENAIDFDSSLNDETFLTPRSQKYKSAYTEKSNSFNLSPSPSPSPSTPKKKPPLPNKPATPTKMANSPRITKSVPPPPVKHMSYSPNFENGRSSPKTPNSAPVRKLVAPPPPLKNSPSPKIPNKFENSTESKSSPLLKKTSPAPPTPSRKSTPAPPTPSRKSTPAPPTPSRKSTPAPPTPMRKSTPAPPTPIRKSTPAPPLPSSDNDESTDSQKKEQEDENNLIDSYLNQDDKSNLPSFLQLPKESPSNSQSRNIPNLCEVVEDNSNNLPSFLQLPSQQTQPEKNVPNLCEVINDNNQDQLSNNFFDIQHQQPKINDSKQNKNRRNHSISMYDASTKPSGVSRYNHHSRTRSTTYTDSAIVENSFYDIKNKIKEENDNKDDKKENEKVQINKPTNRGYLINKQQRVRSKSSANDNVMNLFFGQPTANNSDFNDSSNVIPEQEKEQEQEIQQEIEPVEPEHALVPIYNRDKNSQIINASVVPENEPPIPALDKKPFRGKTLRWVINVNCYYS